VKLEKQLAEEKFSFGVLLQKLLLQPPLVNNNFLRDVRIGFTAEIGICSLDLESIF
jgi:hypothetical protein